MSTVVSTSTHQTLCECIFLHFTTGASPSPRSGALPGAAASSRPSRCRPSPLPRPAALARARGPCHRCGCVQASPSLLSATAFQPQPSLGACSLPPATFASSRSRREAVREEEKRRRSAAIREEEGDGIGGGNEGRGLGSEEGPI
jgi:hypothetical protein